MSRSTLPPSFLDLRKSIREAGHLRIDQQRDVGRTGQDFAEQLRILAEEEYPDAEVIVLVTDNLNTHTPSCLYERFAPAQARRIARRLEGHYTPEHGSWLNIAECELSVLARQCLHRRIPSKAALQEEVAAWETRRNTARVTVD